MFKRKYSRIFSLRNNDESTGKLLEVLDLQSYWLKEKYVRISNISIRNNF